MTDAASDLAGLIAPHWSAEAGPRPGIAASAGLELGQGTVETWDPLVPGGTVVRYRGIDLVDPPVFSSTDILVIRPGDQVAIMSSTPGGGSGSYFVLGRITIPGTPSVEQSLDFLQGDLAKAIAAQVLAERVHTATAGDTANRTSDTYGDPTTGTAGPTVTDVSISESGKAIVLICGHHSTSVGTSYTSTHSGLMSVEVSGATSIPASDLNAAMLYSIAVDSSARLVSQINAQGTMTRTVLFEGLNPGTHTFTAKYRRWGSSDNLTVYNRALVVIAL